TTTISPRPATAARTPVAVAPGASESLGSLAQASSPAIASPVSRARRSGLVRTTSGRIPRAASRSPTARAWSRPSGVSRRSSSGSPGAASAWRTKKTRGSAPSSNTCRLLARDHAAPEPTLALAKAASLGRERVRPLAWCSRPRSSAASLEGALMGEREREEHPADLGPGTPGVPRGWVRHPRERMLITPLMAGIGGLLAFFVVVAIVVWLPIHTFDPPPSADWAPLDNPAVAGRHLFAANGCYVCHSGYSRPQDVREALYFLYPKVSQPGDFFGSDQSPNLL